MPNLADGDYRFVVVTEATDTLYESPAGEGNNLGAAQLPITVSHPDLTVTKLNSSLLAESGSTVAVSWTVRNAGSGDARGEWSDRIYLSVNDTLDGGDIPLGFLPRSGPVASGSSYSGQTEVVLPMDVRDAYYLLVRSDDGGVVNEVQAESNNVRARPILITLAPFADLQTSKVSVNTELAIGDPAYIDVTWTVSNVGIAAGVVDQWVDQILVGDRVVASFSHLGALEVGEKYTRTETVALPAGTTGRLNVSVRTDGLGQVFENLAESNNIATASKTVDVMPISYADLQVTGVQATPGFSGKPIEVSWNVANRGIGSTSTADWADHVWLSRNADGSEVLVDYGWFGHSGVLAPNGSYDRKVEVNLPEGQSGTIYAFVKTGGPFEFIYTDNNQGVSGPVQMTLSPSPDLQVADILAPVSAKDGEMIDVNWTVSNFGQGNAIGSWNDLILLRPLSNPSAATLTLGSFNNSQTLMAGQSYTRTEQFRLPARLSGVYQVVVSTNNTRSLYEYGFRADNNVLLDESPFTVALQARPDVQVSDLQVPAQVVAGGTLSTRFTVINQGTAATTVPHWEDKVYLSLDNRYSGDDIFLGTYANGAALEPGEQYATTTASVTVPLRFRGDVYVIAVTDAGDVLDEYPNDANNVRVATVYVEPQPFADLVTGNVVAPNRAQTGSQLDVRYTVTNKGAGATNSSAWNDTVWLTRDKRRPSSANGAILLGTFAHNGALNVGEGYDGQVSVTLPGNLPSGINTYYLTVWSDAYDVILEDTLAANTNPDDPNEFDNNNYKARVIQVNGAIADLPPVSVPVLLPNLTVASVIPDATATGGEFFTVRWTVQNLDEGAATGSWTDQVYLSNTPTLSASGSDRIYLGGVVHNQPVAPNASYTVEQTFRLPPTAKGQYVIVVADGDRRLGETVETDNEWSGDTLVNPRAAADLVVSSVVVPRENFSGEKTLVQWTVTNIGTDMWSGTNYWIDDVWISPDPEFISNRAVHVGKFAHGNEPLLHGDSYSQTTEVTLPAGISQKWYAHVFIDVGGGLTGSDFTDRAYEKPSSNYAKQTIPITYREPDLKLASLLAPDEAVSGQEISVQWQVSNFGTRATRQSNWTDTVYLSRDASLDGGDIRLKGFDHQGVLAADQGYTTNATINLPEGIEGQFFLLVQGDSGNGVPEFQDEGNNIFAQPITINLRPSPDLRVTQITVPEHAIIGQTFALNYQVSNLSAGATLSGQSNWTDEFYLSRDAFLDFQADRYLGSRSHSGGLDGNSSYQETVNLTLPADWLGSYYVFAVTDPARGSVRGNVFENENERNNTAVSAQPLLIELPPPSDLQVDSIVTGGSVRSGDPIQVAWTISNHGISPAEGSWTDSVYLSTDSTWDIEDRLLGRVEHSGALLNNQAYTASLLSAVPPLSEGQYHIIVRTDIYNQVFEGTGEDNNKAASPDPLTVTVDTLHLGVAVDTTINTDQLLIFKIEVPADETLRVRITSPAKTASHELFLRYGDVPSGFQFDAIYQDPLQADQIAVIPNTKAGTYYVLVHGQAEPSPATPVQVTADIVPLAISAIRQDQGGDSGFVTVTIEGARFDPKAIVKLIRPDIAEIEPVKIKFVDSTKILATFDFQGVPHGLYDIEVINPNGKRVSEPYRYLVERAIEPEVTIGIGGPRVVLAGDVGTYGVSFQSLTNIDTPYVKFTFGAPEMGQNPQIFGLPYVSTVTNLRGSADGGSSDIPWASLESEVNTTGQVLAPGYLLDLGAGDFTGLTFNVSTYPGLKEMWAREYPALKARMAAVFPNLDALLADDGQGLDQWWDGLRSELIDKYPAFTEELQNLDLSGMIKSGLKFPDEDKEVFIPFRFNVTAAATAMTREEFVIDQTTEALKLREAILADNTTTPALQVLAANPDTWIAAYLAALEQGGLLRPEGDIPPLREDAKAISLQGVLATGILLGPSGDQFTTTSNLLNFFEQIHRWYGDNPGKLSPTAGQDHRENKWLDELDIPIPKLPTLADFDQHLSSTTQFQAFNVFVPWIPFENRSAGMALPEFGSVASSIYGEATGFFDLGKSASGILGFDVASLYETSATSGNFAGIIGPLGFGTDQFLPAGQALPYSIQFENPGAASTTPGRIEIISKLDTDLDARTFRLGDLKIGDIKVHIPEGRASFQGDFDFSRSKGFILRVTAGVDVASSTASWLIEAIDPLTGEVIRDTSKGLLPPNNALGIGLGTVGYSILPKADAATRDNITASARVLFNTAAPQDTAVIKQILDAQAPVTKLTATRIGERGADYLVNWEATEDAGGSGVKHVTVYVSEDGGDFKIWLRQTNETSDIYKGQEGHRYEFLALATDNSGNRETPPASVLAPDDGSQVNLGSLPSFETTPTDPPPAPSPEPTTNPLFVEARKEIPNIAQSTRPTEYTTVLSPFSAEAFATGFRQSHSGIGPLAILPLADGSILVSGGTNRGELYQFGHDGGVAGTPLIRLDQPIFDLVLDSNQRLWATTGGGPLLELDLASGQIIAEHGDGLTQALAIDPITGKIYVSSGNGVEIFDPVKESFTHFSDFRVDDLAFSPNGELWGTAWPDRGDVVKFSLLGRAQPMLRLEAKVDSLAFGLPGTRLQDLLFVTTNGGPNGAGGDLRMVALATLQQLVVARGGSRGEAVQATADGRLLIGQSNQIDVLAPLFAPRVVATNPPDEGKAALPFASLSIVFDQDMEASSATGKGSVINPANYTLTGSASGTIVIRSVRYDAASRTVTLQTDPLSADRFYLTLSDTLASRFGATLSGGYTTQFATTQDLSSQVRIDFLDVRSSRGTGTVSYDVRVTNIGESDLIAPLVLALDPARYFEGQPLGSLGRNDLGLWLIDLSQGLTGGLLRQGESTLAHTVTISDPLGQRIDFGYGIYALPAPNEAPVFQTTPVTQAKAGETYSYTAQAVDSGGWAISYFLESGPEGMTLDAQTGVLTWTPTHTSPEQVPVVLQAYDRQGAHASQAFAIAVSGVNHAPQLVDFSTPYQINEGESFILPLPASDTDGDSLFFYADGLPGGARLDPELQALVWTPGFNQAGEYTGITIAVSDGLAQDRTSLHIQVLPVDRTPILLTPPERTVREGDPIRIQLQASDPDLPSPSGRGAGGEGDGLFYSSNFLPGGSFLDPNTGEFQWTPGYTQAGDYRIPFSVSDGHSSATVTATLHVLNVNGQPVFDRQEGWQVQEGQTLFFRAFAFDPENSSFVPQDRLPDGQLTPLLETDPTVTYTVGDLPSGASFDPATAMFSWTPGFTQAGTYSVTFTASDDGDGTGTPGMATLTVPITVVNANHAPVIAEIANLTLDREQTVDLPITSTDADGNPVTLSVTGLPDFANFIDRGDGTGLLRFTTGATDRGNHMVTLTATDNGDGGGAAAILGSSRSFVVSIRVPNETPVLDFVGDKVAVVGEKLSFILHAGDIEQNPLQFSGAGLPAGAVITAQPFYGTALVEWTPAYADLGAHSVTFRVADDGNDGKGPVGLAEQTITIRVRSSNAAPVLNAVGNLTVTERETLSVQLSGSDSDGDPLSYSAIQLPAGASLDTQTGLLSWTPNLIQAGDYDGVVLTVSDGNRTDSETISLHVDNLNQAPILVPVANQSTRETAELSFTLLAEDGDGDPIAFYSLTPLPAGAHFDARTATFSWTPGYEQAGDYTLKFGVQDPQAAKAATEIKVHVDNLDRAPVLTPEKHQVRLGEAFELALKASDPDKSTTLTYSAKGLPEGANLNTSTGVLSWTPGAGQSGDYLVMVSVSDGEIAVTEPLVLRASNAPVAPVVTIEQTPSFAAVPGQPVVVHVLAAGFAEISTTTLTVNGVSVALDETGTARIKADQPGRLELVATATDADGLSNTATSSLRVRDPNDKVMPVVQLDARLGGSQINAPTNILATISDSNLDPWTLELLPLGANASSGAVQLASGELPSLNQSLFRLDPGLYANGVYRLRLTATDMAGRVGNSEAVVEINSVTKSGQYRRTETDLSVTLGGVPLDIVREYDSLSSANDGSFGPGWRLALRDLDVQTDVALTGREASGVVNPFRAGSRIYLTLLTGERVGFTFQPEKHELPGLTYYTPAFVADGNPGWSLRASDTRLSLAGSAYYDLATARPYNPVLSPADGLASAPLILIAPDATIYEIDPARGVTGIVAANGTRLIVSDSGIYAPDGSAIRFSTDVQGRLDSLNGPDGSRIVYGYDASGHLASVRKIGETTSSHYGYDSQQRLNLITGAAGFVVDYTGISPQVLTLTGDLGAARGYLAAPHASVLATGGTDRYAFVVRPSEFASTAGGAIYFGVVLEAESGSNLQPAIPEIPGLTPIASRIDGNQAFALFSLPSTFIGSPLPSREGPGVRAIGDALQLLQIKGNTPQTTGAYKLTIFAAGDVNRDSKVDGTDAQLLAQARGTHSGEPGYLVAADANLDGVIDAADNQLLFQNLGFAPNQPPTITPKAVKTHEDLEFTVSVADFVKDQEGDSFFIGVSGATHGTAKLAADGQSIIFMPETGYTGAASYELFADDGYSMSPSATMTVNVSDAKLTGFKFDRVSLLSVGESSKFIITGDFEDEANVRLPASYLNFSSTDPAIVRISPDGSFYGVAEGNSILKFASHGIQGINAITVYSIPELSPEEEAEYEFESPYVYLDTYPDTLTLLSYGTGRQFHVWSEDGTDITDGSTGTIYFVSNPSVASVTEDGFVVGLESGFTTLSVIFQGGQLDIPVKVQTPSTGPTLIGSSGGAVQSTNGLLVTVGPGTLTEDTSVSINTVSQAELPLSVPDTFQLAGAFKLELGDDTLDLPVQLAVPVATVIQPGSSVYFYRYVELPDENGVKTPLWLFVESGVVGADGIARTASPPAPGVRAGGTYLVLVNNLAQSANLYAPNLSSSFTGFALLEGFGANMGVALSPFGPVPMPVPNINGFEQVVMRIYGQGNVLTTPAPVAPQTIDNVTYYSVTVTPPATGNASLSPEISTATLATPATGGVELTLKGSLFGNDLNKLKVVFTVGNREITAVPTDVSGTPDHGEIKVMVPKGVIIGVADIHVRLTVTDPFVDAMGNPFSITRDQDGNSVKVIPTGGLVFVAVHPNVIKIIDGASTEILGSVDFPGAALSSTAPLAATPDQTRVYAGLRTGGIAVVDVVGRREGDASLATPDDLDRITLDQDGVSRLPGIHGLATDPSGSFLYALGNGAGIANVVYVIDIRPYSDQFHQVVAHIDIPLADAPMGLAGMAISADGRRIYAAAPKTTLTDGPNGQSWYDGGREKGNIIVINIDPNDQPVDSAIGNPRNWRQVIAVLEAGYNPFHVVATSDPGKIAFTNFLDMNHGFATLEVTNDDPTDFQATIKSISLNLPVDLAYNLDIQNARGLAVTPDLQYAFVSDWFVFDFPNRRLFRPTDPQDYAILQGRGAKVGIIKDPFGPNPQLVASTTPVLSGFGDRMALSPDGKYLYADFRGAGSAQSPSEVKVFDVDVIRSILDNASPQVLGQLGKQPIENLYREVQVSPLNVSGMPLNAEQQEPSPMDAGIWKQAETHHFGDLIEVTLKDLAFFNVPGHKYTLLSEQEVLSYNSDRASEYKLTRFSFPDYTSGIYDIGENKITQESIANADLAKVKERNGWIAIRKDPQFGQTYLVQSGDKPYEPYEYNILSRAEGIDGHFYFVPYLDSSKIANGEKLSGNNPVEGKVYFSALVKDESGVIQQIKFSVVIELTDPRPTDKIPGVGEDPGFTKFTMVGTAVGENKENRPLDVYRIQQRLRYLGFVGAIDSGAIGAQAIQDEKNGDIIRVNGDLIEQQSKYDKDLRDNVVNKVEMNTTLYAIRTFQGTYYPSGEPTPVDIITTAGSPRSHTGVIDGVVDATGKAMKWLNAVNAPRWKKLIADTNFGIKPNNDGTPQTEVWATDWTIDLLKRALDNQNPSNLSTIGYDDRYDQMFYTSDYPAQGQEQNVPLNYGFSVISSASQLFTSLKQMITALSTRSGFGHSHNDHKAGTNIDVAVGWFKDKGYWSDSTDGLLISDNKDPVSRFVKTGDWVAEGQGFNGGITTNESFIAANTTPGNNTAEWKFSNLAPGDYEIWMTWQEASTLANNIPIEFLFSGNNLEPNNTKLDQTKSPKDSAAADVSRFMYYGQKGGKGWFHFSTVNLTGNSVTVKMTDIGLNAKIAADAVLLVPKLNLPQDIGGTSDTDIQRRLDAVFARDVIDINGTTRYYLTSGLMEWEGVTVRDVASLWRVGKDGQGAYSAQFYLGGDGAEPDHRRILQVLDYIFGDRFHKDNNFGNPIRGDIYLKPLAGHYHHIHVGIHAPDIIPLSAALATDQEIAPSLPVYNLYTADLPNTNEIIRAAESVWTADMASFESIVLGKIDVSISSLEGELLAVTEGDVNSGVSLYIDSDAAGNGWFVDSTPLDNSEFSWNPTSGEWVAKLGSPADGHIDLVTVFAHELGHVMGFDHIDQNITPVSIMSTPLKPGVRRLPTDADRAALAALLSGGENLTVTSNFQPDSVNALTSAWISTTLPSADSQLLSFSAPNAVAGTELSNGNFSLTDPASVPFGWTINGAGTVIDGQAVLKEDSRTFSELSQSFAIPENAQTLRFNLPTIHFESNGAAPSDTFEVALLGFNSKQPLTGTVTLSHTDALLNIQADGRVLTAPSVSVSGLVNGYLPGEITEPLVVTIDLSGITAESIATLYFDLLGFGAAGSQVSIDDVELILGAQAPKAVNDTLNLNEDAGLSFDVRLNDQGVVGTGFVVERLLAPTQGQLELLADGSFHYTPDANFNGEDSFTYRLSEGNQVSNVATVYLNVQAVNDAPVAQADFATLTEDSPLIIDVLVNDSDLDGNALAVSQPGTAAHGRVEILDDGHLRYTPDADYFGDDRFVYTLSDGMGGVASAEVILKVTPVDDAPRAQDDTVSLEEDGSARFDVRSNDLEPDGQTLTVELLSSPSQGQLTLQTDGSFIYRPNANVFGNDQFSYRLSEGKLVSSVATVNLLIAPVNDAPQVDTQRFVIASDTTLTTQLLAVDPEGDALSFTVAQQPVHGAFVVSANGQLEYRPDAGFSGVDSFLFAVSDGDTLSQARGEIRVESGNQAPVAVGDVIQVDENSATRFDPLLNDHDAENDPLTVQLIAGPIHGTLTAEVDGTYLYQPETNFNGEDSFTYRADDGRLSSGIATVRLQVQAVNYAPTPKNDEQTLAEDSSADIAVLANDSDPDGDALTVSTVSTPEHGRVELLAGGVLRYTPQANFNGLDKFSYVVADPSGLKASAEVVLHVTPVSEPPRVLDQTFDSLEDVLLSNRLAASDADGDVLHFAVQQTATHGQVTVNSDGLFEYRPNADFFGNDSFMFSVTDGQNSVTASAEIRIAPVADAPIAVDDYFSVAEDGSTNIDVLTNDHDPDGDSITMELLSAPSHGELLRQNDGTYLFTPTANFSGEDSFLYRISDGTLTSATATVHLTVQPGNDPPVAKNDSAQTAEDTSVDIDVLANDSDPDGDALTVGSVGIAEHGSVAILADGKLRYTPAADYFGEDRFSYSILDAGGASAHAEVVVMVKPVNDAPDAPVQIFNAISAQRITGQIVATDREGDTLSFLLEQLPTHGQLGFNSDGHFEYVSDARFNGTDIFTYSVSDGLASTTSRVDITVRPTNEAPIARNDNVAVDEDTTIRFDLRDNDTDADGDPLQVIVTESPVHGVLVLGGDGKFTYTPNGDYFGSDIFHYRLNDGQLDSNTAEVQFSVAPVNDAPRIDGIVNLGSIDEDSAGLSITKAQLLSKVVDVDAILWASFNLVSPTRQPAR